MDVNKHDRLLELTHIQRFKYRKSPFIAVLYFSHCSVFNNEHFQDASYQQAKCISLWYVENQHWKVCVNLQVRELASPNSLSI
jgi:hypothetical protein